MMRSIVLLGVAILAGCTKNPPPELVRSESKVAGHVREALFVPDASLRQVLKVALTLAPGSQTVYRESWIFSSSPSLTQFYNDFWPSAEGGTLVGFKATGALLARKVPYGNVARVLNVRGRRQVLLVPASKSLEDGIRGQTVEGDTAIDRIEVSGNVFTLSSIRSKARSGSLPFLSAYVLGRASSDCQVCSALFERLQEQFGVAVEEVTIAAFPVFYDDGPEFSPSLIPTTCTASPKWCDAFLGVDPKRRGNIFHRQVVCRRTVVGRSTCYLPYPDALK